MVSTEREVVWSRVNGGPIEIFNGDLDGSAEDPQKKSLMQAILERRGFESLNEMYFAPDKSRRIPPDILREVMLVDNIYGADELTKIKIATYRVWENDGHYSRIKDYFPETSTGLEFVQRFMPKREGQALSERVLERYVHEVMMDEDELGFLYRRIHNASEEIDNILPISSGITYFRQYEILAKIILEVLKDNPDLEITNEMQATILNEYAEKCGELGVESKRGISEKEKIERLKRMENENPIITEVEKLRKKGLYQKDISRILNIPERRIEKILRALYLEKRAKPQPEHVKRTRRFMKLASKVEILRKQGLTVRQIANNLEVDEKRVADAIGILIFLGRIEQIDPTEVLRRRHRTEERKEKVRKALRDLMTDNPGEQITFSELRQIAEVDVSLQTLGVWYGEIAAREEVPPHKNDARERAVDVLMDLGKSSKDPISIHALSRQTKIAYRTLLRAYDDIRHNPDAPVLLMRDTERKKREFVDALSNFSITNPGENFSIRAFCKKIGLNYTTAVRWYREMSSSEDLPPIRSVWKRSS